MIAKMKKLLLAGVVLLTVIFSTGAASLSLANYEHEHVVGVSRIVFQPEKTALPEDIRCVLWLMFLTAIGIALPLAGYIVKGTADLIEQA